MKKLLLLGILILALFAFVACGDEEAEDTTDGTESTEENGDAEDIEEAVPAVEVDLSSAEKCVEAFLKVATDKDADLLSAICTTVSEESHQFMIDNIWPAIDPGELVIEGGYEIVDNENGTFDVDFESALFSEGDETRSMSLLVKELDGNWVICGNTDSLVKTEE